MKPKVFVSRRIPEVGLSRIRTACDADVWPERLPPPYETIKARIADCDGFVSLLTDKIDAALLDAAPRLKVVSNFAVGFNNIDVAAATARGIAVGNTPGVLTDATADIAMTLLQSGGSDYPMALLKRAGVDLSQPDTVRAIVDELDRLVTKLEEELTAINA